MAIYVVNIKFVPEETERRLAARPDHRAYLAELKAEGKLVNAGPMADGTEAILIYNVADKAELDEILANDPYPADVYELAMAKEWTPLFDV